MKTFNAVILLRIESKLPLEDLRAGLPWFLKRWFRNLHGGNFRVVQVEVVQPK